MKITGIYKAGIFPIQKKLQNNLFCFPQDTLRSSCDNSLQCTSNCCVSRYVAPLFFVSFVLFAQFVLVNIVIAVLMKHLRVTSSSKKQRDFKKLSKKRGGVENPAKSGRSTFIMRRLNKWRQNVSLPYFTNFGEKTLGQRF